jgi:hypothetical protein
MLEVRVLPGEPEHSVEGGSLLGLRHVVAQGVFYFWPQDQTTLPRYQFLPCQTNENSPSRDGPQPGLSTMLGTQAAHGIRWVCNSLSLDEIIPSPQRNERLRLPWADPNEQPTNCDRYQEESPRMADWMILEEEP